MVVAFMSLCVNIKLFTHQNPTFIVITRRVPVQRAVERDEIPYP